MNLVEYIKKFSNVSFSERSFNDVDVAVLTTLSYAKFESIVPSIVERKAGIKISDFSDSDIIELSKVNTFSTLIIDMMNALKESSRFNKITVENSMSVMDSDALEQFFAITYNIPGVGLLISFRGTDGSTIGWKENFSVLYKGATLSQIDAIEYLNQISGIHKDESYILSGHSKGGNLCLYSLFFGSDEIRSKISHIYSFDGYGFKNKEYKNKDNYNELVEKVTQIAPEESIIGELFYTPNKYKVIKASGKGVSSHHPLNWEVSDKGEFIEAEKRCFKSRFFHRLVKKWSLGSSDYSYKVFTDIIVDALDSDSGEFEIGSNSNKTIKRILKSARKKTLKEKLSFIHLVLKLGLSVIGCFFYYMFNK